MIAEQVPEPDPDLAGPVAQLIAELVDEYGDLLPPYRIEAATCRCRNRLARQGVNGQGLLHATEAMARVMLEAEIRGIEVGRYEEPVRALRRP